MFTTLGSYLALGAWLLALYGWWRGREPLRHDALLLGGILLYFGIGTVDIHVVPYEVSPRFLVPRAVWGVVAWGTVGYLAGAWLARRGAATGSRPVARNGAGLGFRIRALLWVGWAGLVVLLIASRAPALTGADREGVSGYWVAPAMLLVPGTLLTLAALGRRPHGREWALLALALVLLLATGYRTYTLLLGLSVCVLFYLDLRSLKARFATLAAGAALVLAVGVGYGYWRMVRHADPSLELRFVRAVAGREDASPLRMAGAYVFASLFREGPSILGFLVDRHPRVAPFAHGRGLWGMVTSPLPGQQLDTRAIISRELHAAAGKPPSEGTSLVSSIFGPWYIDFGTAGVALGMLLLAFGLGRVERSAFSAGDPCARAGYAYGLVLYGLAIHTGLSDFSLMVLIPLAFLWVAGWLQPPGRHRALALEPPGGASG